jgi:hypothetical protein
MSIPEAKSQDSGTNHEISEPEIKTDAINTARKAHIRGMYGCIK